MSLLQIDLVIEMTQSRCHTTGAVRLKLPTNINNADIHCETGRKNVPGMFLGAFVGHVKPIAHHRQSRYIVRKYYRCVDPNGVNSVFFGIVALFWSQPLRLGNTGIIMC